jgi:hypothetical protein
MNRLSSWLATWCVLAAGPAWAASRPAQAERYPGADPLGRQIDRRLAAGYEAARVTPAALADDSEFVRRVYLDLAGRIPTVSEARAFLADRRADRRKRLVEKLLDGSRFSSHFATVWRSLLLPETSANFQARFQAPIFERWLRDWLDEGKGLDWMVHELVSMALAQGMGNVRFAGQPAGNPSAFYAVKDYQPEELASAVARLFLGVNIGCAQCHNHPFASWKREQFWEFAAFFAGIKSRRQGDFVQLLAEQPALHEITIPGTERTVKARFLGGKQPAIGSGARARAVLADWMVSKDNPYFARAAVNRLWAHFFGTGLVEPLDEMAGGDARPSHPELLDELAKGFAKHNYDLKWLIRAITSSQAYQRSSRRGEAGQDDPRLFARMHLRGLTPEQLFDSLATATGYQAPQARNPFFGVGSVRSEFLARFANATDRPTEVQTSILQALAMMNGQLTVQATDLQRSETLAAVIDAPFMDTPAKIEALYLAGLSRKPTAKELSRLVRYVAAGGVSTAKDKARRQAEALADVFWAILNSGEFKFNH